MYNCICCGIDMGLSISSLCDRCLQRPSEIKNTNINESAFNRNKTKNGINKEHIIKKILSLGKSKPKGLYSSGSSKGYNAAIGDIVKIIQEEF